MAKKKLPVFIFTAKSIIGKELLEQTNQTHTTNGEPILKTKKYDCFKDCNGVRIQLSK